MEDDIVYSTYQFLVREKGQWLYILWPYPGIEDLLYDGLQYGTMYKIIQPPVITRSEWMYIEPVAGAWGEYRRHLMLGSLPWGTCIYRRFMRRGTHYLTQHGLDGMPHGLVTKAREVDPGVPKHNILFKFRIIPASGGVFDLSFWEWIQYFTNGRNETLGDMAMIIIKNGRT